MGFNTTGIAAHRWQLSIGERLPVWSVQALNDARDSNNPMHDDTVARQLGFAGGLVPGVTLFGYLTRPFAALFGEAFLGGAAMDIRFRRPVYEGTWVSTAVEVTDVAKEGAVFAARLLDAAGEACVVATVTMPEPGRTSRALPPTRPLPGQRRPARPESLRAEPVFGTLEGCVSLHDATAYTAMLGDDAARYAGLVHPAWLLRQANLVVDRNLELGPWIHVGSEVSFLGPVRANEPWTARGEVLALNTHKGREYADLDIAIGGATPALRVRHKVIYRMEEA
jgi:acyl dehydratase